MPTDLVQEVCNGRNGCNGPQPRDVTVAEAILTSIGTPQLNSPGGSMGAEAILDHNFKENPDIGPPQPQKFRLRRA